MRTYNKGLDGETYTFRLTVGAQKELEKKRNESAMHVILNAATDATAMTDLLGASAKHKGNANATVDGDELYDLMVDAGVCGQVDWLEIACGIGAASGVLTDDMATKTVEAMRLQINGMLDELSDPMNLERGTVRAGEV